MAYTVTVTINNVNHQEAFLVVENVREMFGELRYTINIYRTLQTFLDDKEPIEETGIHEPYDDVKTLDDIYAEVIAAVRYTNVIYTEPYGSPPVV